MKQNNGDVAKGKISRTLAISNNGDFAKRKISRTLAFSNFFCSNAFYVNLDLCNKQFKVIV